MVLDQDCLRPGVGATGQGRGYTTSKKHKCLYCPYTTNQHSHLTAHYRTHTGEKPFSCPYCTHHSMTTSDLNKHIRIHTGEKPFACPHCSYRSTQNSSLKSHLRTHREKPWCSQELCRRRQSSQITPICQWDMGMKVSFSFSI